MDEQIEGALFSAFKLHYLLIDAATMRAWRHPYIGEAHRCLYNVMEAHQKNGTAYGRFLSIVQSSGTGKSRMVDELSKEHIVIPINLRAERANGFPAADHNVRNFLDNCTSQREVYTRYAAFFTVLFQQLLIRLQTIDSDWRKYSVETNTKVSTAFRFRFLMTQNQTYGEPNEYRRTFYQQVCQKAEKVSNGIYTLSFKLERRCFEEIDVELPTSMPFDLCDAARDAVHFFEPSKVNQKLDALSPFIILAFDEAHMLTKVHGNAQNPWSRFGVLRHIIRELKSLPIFSLFISTDSKISDLTPQDMSMGMVNEATLLRPFTELGFDQLLGASPITENTRNIQDAATVRLMCQFGRPLFVAIFCSLLFY
ncbi:hypothetical protein AX14_003014 [Amanita brunnescens Koide BX004]|nr:hypothetical protein AX14_003014 [Amanita brunnescens Koide BX004]